MSIIFEEFFLFFIVFYLQSASLSIPIRHGIFSSVMLIELHKYDQIVVYSRRWPKIIGIAFENGSILMSDLI
jgi:hypothetical protein